MQARSERCSAQWKSHYQNCRETILESCKSLAQKRKVLIFGAGSLQDIPLDYLASHFDEVLLVDLVFLKPARKLVTRFSNVQLIEHDVTESLVDTFQASLLIKQPISWLDESAVDLVVSLNLITQLPLIPVRWLLSQGRINEAEADKIGQQLIANHLIYLQNFSAKTCLIADRVDVEYDLKGQEIDRFDPWWKVPQPPQRKQWQWEVAPFGEISSRKRQVNTVGVSIF